MIELNRQTIDIFSVFPPVSDFPRYSEADSNLAVLVRLFRVEHTSHDKRRYVNMALWSMRSHMLNSDMRDYMPTVVFHVEDKLYDSTKHFFGEAGVPDENIVVFSSSLLPDSPRGFSLHKACAPMVDPQIIDRFERVIVLDADLFSISNEATGLLPLLRVSIDEMPPDQICLLRSWTNRDIAEHVYRFWFQHCERDETEWMNTAAAYCNTTTDKVREVMFPSDLDAWRPFHNGAYINFHTRLFKDSPKFQRFVYKVSCDMGNEEMALAVWAIKQFIEKGSYFPPVNASLLDYVTERAPETFCISYDLDGAWGQLSHGVSSLTHLYGFNKIESYIDGFLTCVHASESEREAFKNGLSDSIQKLRNSDS